MPLWTNTGFLFALAALQNDNGEPSNQSSSVHYSIVAPVILDDVPQVMFTVIEKQPNLAVCVRQEYLQGQT